MTKVIVDEGLRSRLDVVDGQAELCDESGRTLGRFLTEELYHKWLYESVEVPFSAEEAERRRNETGGRGWPEIRESLRGNR
ncbi:MAG: hypothetical protein WD066_18295 [Planctomycetaceae bacterium]